ncbi:MAG TPA: hypothetical protein VGL06_16145 [Pseudonocardiaceae bacterium]
MSYSGIILFFGIMSAVSGVGLAMLRAAGRKQASDRAVNALRQRYTGEITHQERVAAAFDASYWCRLTVRCDDGTTMTLTVPSEFSYCFRPGRRIVKHPGEQWPVGEGTPPLSSLDPGILPSPDPWISPCYRTSGGIMVHVQPDCRCTNGLRGNQT